MSTTQYDLTTDKLTQLYNHVNELVDDAGNPETGNYTVIQSVNDLQQELGRHVPASWWVGRDQEFDELRTFIKSVEDTDRRKDRVTKFTNHMTVLLLDGDLTIEP